MTTRRRVDRLLVERGLFDTRAQAQAAIAAGQVTADEVIVRRASQTISPAAVLCAEPAHPWVSRGGVKLAAALDAFGFDPGGHMCIDIGAATGGFTEVLLARRAARVYAIDVGHGQLHSRLHARPKVISLEGTDIRKLARAKLAPPPDFAVIDVSFISLKLVLPAVFVLLEPRAKLVALIKPQFEAGRKHLKKGIVRDAQIRTDICQDIAAFIRTQGWKIVGVLPSPLAGGDGNLEFLIGAARE